MEIESKQPLDSFDKTQNKSAQDRHILERRKEIDPTSPSPSHKASADQRRLRWGKEQFTLQDIKDVIFHEDDDMIYPHK